MILVLDNYDSFTYNLVQYLGELGRSRTCAGMTSDRQRCRAHGSRGDRHSPGPGTPADAGISISLIKHFHSRLPILGCASATRH